MGRPTSRGGVVKTNYPDTISRAVPVSKARAGMAIAAAATIAVVLTMSVDTGAFQQVQAALFSPAPMAFADRYPARTDFPFNTAAIEDQLRQAQVPPPEAVPSEIVKPDISAGQAVQSQAPRIPLPRSRPSNSLFASGDGLSDSQKGYSASATAPSDVRSVFEKVSAILQSARLTLASAAPDGGVSNDGEDRSSGSAAYDSQTAVYDITARAVFMPDGTKLEAHSGLGDLLDDPSHVAVRDRGATPPNLYELTLRERRFHGVQAIRLKPIGSGDVFGRSGLLAHSYLLGPNGDSNGCVSFKDYDAFLKSFLNGDVKRLVVVKSISDDLTRYARKV